MIYKIYAKKCEFGPLWGAINGGGKVSGVGINENSTDLRLKFPLACFSSAQKVDFL